MVSGTEFNPESFSSRPKIKYDKAWEKILASLDSCQSVIQQQALNSAKKLMAKEGKSSSKLQDDPRYYFPLHRLKSILMTLLSPEKDNTKLISKFQKITVYPDALYYTWRCLPSVTPKSQPPRMYVKNLLELIHKIPLPKEGKESKMTNNKELLCGPQEANFTWDQLVVKRELNKVWGRVMHWKPMTPQLHKQLLIVLLDRIISHLDKPVLLTDFLMDSLDAEGSISLLALHGIFILVTKHNIEYSNIFTKLYSMFEPEIFHTKHKARLFYLSDLFFSSTHLPLTLVGAFAKRLSRLTLVAPPEDILIILPFVGNLMRRHAGIKELINRSEDESKAVSNACTVAGDPFLMEERDPMLSNAMHSSLWEIRALQSHILPSIVNAARFIDNPLPSVENDLAPVLERTSDYIFDHELRNKFNNITLTFEKPNGMALPKGEKLLQYWQLTGTY